MTHLVCRAYYDNEDLSDVPGYFVMEIDKPVIEYLKNKIDQVVKFNSGTQDLLKAEFYFGFGIWTKFDEILEDNFQEDFQISEKVNELFVEDGMVEFEFVESCRIEIYHDGDFRFSFYPKYGVDKFYTCIMSLDELQKEK